VTATTEEINKLLTGKILLKEELKDQGLVNEKDIKIIRTSSGIIEKYIYNQNRSYTNIIKYYCFATNKIKEADFTDREMKDLLKTNEVIIRTMMGTAIYRYKLCKV
jgi:hypothetical protein